MNSPPFTHVVLLKKILQYFTAAGVAATGS
jgi:hypothetical protein